MYAMTATIAASSSSIQWAKSPFNKPAANTILRTADDVHFCVHSTILSEASPVFEDMFSLPQPMQGQTQQGASLSNLDSRPIISVDEDSETLDALLRLCYPVTNPELVDVQLVRSVITEALKYQMDEPTAITTGAFRSLAPSHPVRIWAIACILHLEDVALHAASLTVTSGKDISTDYPEEMKELSAGHYYRLLQYHRLRGAVPANFRFLSPPPDADSSNGTGLKSLESYADTLITPAWELFPDLLCRCSNGVEISTHKVILAMASPRLRALIMDLPPTIHRHTSDERRSSRSQLPSLDIQEDSKTFLGLLRLCYPVRPTEIDTLDIYTMPAVILAARNYEMHRVSELLESQLENFILSRPLAVYFTAMQLDLPEHARRAARHLFQHPITDLYGPEMEITPSPLYFSLLRYHAAMGDAVAASLATLEEVSHCSTSCSMAAMSCMNYHPSYYNYGNRVQSECMCSWYNEKLAEVKRNVSTCPCAHDETTKLEAIIEKVIQGQGLCSACAPLARRLVDLASKVQAAVDVNGPGAQVPLKH